MNRIVTLLGSLALVIALQACGGTTKEQVSDDHAGHDHAEHSHEHNHDHDSEMTRPVAADFSRMSFGDRSFKLPMTWITEPVASKMRAAQFHLKSDSTQQLIFYYFGQEVGSAEANLERWKKEYETMEDFQETTLEPCDIKLIEVRGTFKKRASMQSTEYTAMEGYATLAAIIPTSSGPYYFKMVGSQEAVDQERPVVEKFFTSCK